MVVELALLDVRKGETGGFEAAFEQASSLIAASEGYVSHQLQRSLTQPSRYLLLVHWRTLEDHSVGFRQSPAYEEWKRLLHHFYDPFPAVEHFEPVIGSSAR